MFEVGFTEIMLIMGLALLVLGPEKLPGLAAKLGQWTGRARAMARQLRTQLEQEVTVDGFDKPAAHRPTPAADTTAGGHEPAAADSPAHAGEADANPAAADAAAPAAPAQPADAGNAAEDLQTPAAATDAPEEHDAQPAPPAHAPVTLNAQTMVSGMEPEPAGAAQPTPRPAQPAEPGLDVDSMVSGMEPGAAPEPATKPEA